MSDIPAIGFRAAIGAFAAIVLYGTAQILQVLHTLRPPVDGILVYGFSLCIVVPFIIAMLAFHYTAPTRRKFWSIVTAAGSMLFLALYLKNVKMQSQKAVD